MFYEIDENGYFLADVVAVQEGNQYAPTQPPAGFILPRYINGVWVEGGVRPLNAEAIATRRYQAEVAGITINDMRVETDDRAKLLINGAAVEAMLDADYAMQWKTSEGFIELTGAQVIGIARAVRAYVQACFDREAELLAALDNGTLTEEALAAFWPMPAEEDV